MIEEDFSKPKIIFQEIVQESQFMMDSDGIFFCNDTGRIIVGEQLYHLLGIMNSKIFFYSIKHFYGGGTLGEQGIRMKHTFFEQFPCLPFSCEIDSLVRSILNNAKSDECREIDTIIFNLYHFSPNEISLILND